MFDQINNDLKQAMRDKDAFKLSTLRMLLAALKNKKIELGQDAVLTDEVVTSAIKTEIKKRKDSVTAYTDGGRQDLADNEKKEIEILEKYMPEQMSEAEVEKIVKDTIEQLDASSPSDFGKVMGAAMAKTKGQADGNMVSSLVKKNLTAKN